MALTHLLHRSPLRGAGEAALVEAIRSAERGSRGEVRLHVERRCSNDDPVEGVAALFAALGMRATAEDTGVLLYVAFVDRRVAVFAGAGIHAAAREGFWQSVTDAVARGFAAGRPVPALVEALAEIGALLRAPVPGEDLHGNELPDSVSVS